MTLHTVVHHDLACVCFCVLCVYRKLADGLRMLDPFIRFVMCDPCCTAAFQHLRLSLLSTLCLNSVDNTPLIQYLLRLIPLMPVVQLCLSFLRADQTIVAQVLSDT